MTLYDIWAAGGRHVVLDGFVYRIAAPAHLRGMFLLTSKGCKPRSARRIRVYMDTHAMQVTPNDGPFRWWRNFERFHNGIEPV